MILNKAIINPKHALLQYLITIGYNITCVHSINNVVSPKFGKRPILTCRIGKAAYQRFPLK